MFKARPSQQEIINFEKGRMGVSAVPGSGKTHTLSYLAANLIAKGLVGDDQEVLIVTLVNSSVDNFSQRISKFISNFGLMPNFGYRVRTLHGLAHDIVKERPGLVGLENRFEIADERETVEIIERITGNWLKTNPDFVDTFKNKTIENHSSGKVKMGWERLLADIAGSFIRQAKDLELTPQDIRTILDKKQKSSPLLLLPGESGLQNQPRRDRSVRADIRNRHGIPVQAMGMIFVFYREWFVYLAESVPGLWPGE